MTQAIHEYHGTIDKFIGDAIMAIWGAPIKTNTHAEDAVRAALEMMEKLDHVNQWLHQHEQDPLGIGIGVNTGEAILGSIGSDQKADYTVIGDNVNLASRLEGITKQYGCNILIAQSTYEAIAEHIPCRIVDVVKVKGKQQAIQIYTPLGGQYDSAMERLVKLSEEAFHHYLRRDWDAAIQSYSALPEDKLQNLFLSRCRAYQQKPPAEDWDGAFLMTSK
jgi:adenylate cyclase